MSKFTKAVEDQRKNELQKPTENFMGGISYEFDPIETLKMVSASSVFGEPQYYRDGQFSKAKIKDGIYAVDKLFRAFSVLPDKYSGKTTSHIMENIIDEALDYDYKSTIEWAAILRNEYYMRLNPQIIMVRAAIHPDRQKFNQKYPGLFSKIQKILHHQNFHQFLINNKKNAPFHKYILVHIF